jgi:hypothetical protein
MAFMRRTETVGLKSATCLRFLGCLDGVKDEQREGHTVDQISKRKEHHLDSLFVRDVEWECEAQKGRGSKMPEFGLEMRGTGHARLFCAASKF